MFIYRLTDGRATDISLQDDSYALQPGEIEFFGTYLPTVEELSDPAVLQADADAKAAAAAARLALDQTALVTEFEGALRGRTVAEISAYVDNQVTDIASARLMFKRVLAVLSRIV